MRRELRRLAGIVLVVLPAVIFGGGALLAVPAMAAGPSESDRVRIAEAFRIADAIGQRIWPGWSEAPFALLLVTEEREFLIRHPAPSPDFTPCGYDSLLESAVYERERTMDPRLLATFPAVGGVPTIVIGTPENTGKGSSFWVATVIHEHFHQLQMSRPGYNAGVAALDLAGDDSTGMWMLNYPFPYGSAGVQESLHRLARCLLAALKADEPAGSWDAYRDAREKLRASLSPRDERYLSFQLWQEGGARYTEIEAARETARALQPSAAFKALPDFVPFAAVADSLQRRMERELAELDPAVSRRVAFYPIGAAEAMLLDERAPDWKVGYFAEMFRMDRYNRTPADQDAGPRR